MRARTAGRGPASIDRADAEATLRTYFELVAAGDTDAAWELLAPDVQEQFGGFDTWSAGIEARESTELTSLVAAGGGR